MDFNSGDVVFVPFPYREQLRESVRPAVVLSRREFNRRGDLIIAAITSHSSRNSLDVELVDWQQANLLKPSTARMLIATVADVRVLHKVGRLSDRDWSQLVSRLTQVLDIECGED